MENEIINKDATKLLQALQEAWTRGWREPASCENIAKAKDEDSMQIAKKYPVLAAAPQMLEALERAEYYIRTLTIDSSLRKDTLQCIRNALSIAKGDG